MPALTDAQAREARRLMDEIRGNPRGPYGQIRWYCDDGRVLPPQGTPCRPGRGYQHAEPSASARKLELLNIDIAHFLSGMSFEEFLDAPRNYYWLRQMVLIDYLVNRLDGWIYRRAWQRRGVRQGEDEEREARRLLAGLLGDQEWVRRNYLLAVQLGVSVPHGLDNSRTRRIRALSSTLAEKDTRFMSLRSKIHSKPGPEDVASVQEYVTRTRPADPSGFNELLSLLRAEYLDDSSGAQLRRFRERLKGTSVEAAFGAAADAAGGGTAESFLAGSRLALDLRNALSGPDPAARKLDILDALLWTLDQAFRAGAKSGVLADSRGTHLEHVRAWIRYAAAAGLLSLRQHEALDSKLAGIIARGEVPAAAYHEAIRYLARSLEWTRASVMREFGQVTHHYSVIEPESPELIDDILRRSVALPLSREIEFLLADAERGIGRSHNVLGQPVSRGVGALNSGIAIAPLEILERGQESKADFDAGSIYVIPETVADIKPVAGILTLDSGNALSHAQLLAASLGIPNATIPSSLLPALRLLRGQRMFYAVTAGGTVVLRKWDSMSEVERRAWTDQPRQARSRVRLDTSRLDLGDTRLRGLDDVRKSDSGRSVGPKAANLGQLATYFPGRVAPGIVIPFGVFHRHITQSRGSEPSLEQQVRDAYAQAEQMRKAGASAKSIRDFIYPKLAEFRTSIQTMPLLPDFEAEMTRRMREVFGEDGTYGVFVRSDTNAEDLPEFSGAGLNLTVPNVVGRDKVIRALKNVWASPFTERAYEWRSQALESSENVMPSVLLLRTVASDKSGVLVTVNLESLDPAEITVNVNEGVAAVVDGGVAESLLLRPDGSVQLLAQARSPYRRVALPTGGFVEVPTSGSDFVLLPDEISQLRDLVREVKEKYPPSVGENGKPLPWDIEFGFEKGQLRLFQIRPLVRFREATTLAALSRLESKKPSAATIRMDEPVELP